ncbi:MAG: tRNA uridine-5-carboxymethylaminomethyl(34) synthesis enzyme MnmG [Chloroflexi bacterium]|nr:tRNA uridine-5-carboxymethylaminomethyl(34) synthesis enzyme MnmG [Chloroflexota bacterium]
MTERGGAPAAAGRYEVIVVGAGHAGCEAALASARLGRRTLLVTMNLDLLALMPCNPSIGGSGKGQLVREIDALGGEMGVNTDRTSIQIRLLNPSKGPAVQALRAQADKRLYSLCMKHTLERAPNLALRQGRVEQLLTRGDRICGVRLEHGEVYEAGAVVIAGGTFLNGRVLSGPYSAPAGRAGEFAAEALSGALRALGFVLGRMQTNTPPRIDARTIDYAATQPQYGSEEPLYFSADGPRITAWTLPINPVYPIPHQTSWRAQLPCYLVHTNPTTQRVIRDNLALSPIAPGVTEAAGPRYCPSIEDKVVRFPAKESHQFFLEPEGWSTSEVYVQGCFTGLPVEVQTELLHSIPALREAVIVRPGYAIEYDYVPSHQLHATLETRRVHGLFHAGQINGTSGYEEAAAQGLVAGANAARWVRDEEPLVLRRDQAYIGVLIDDLVTREISEPYRILTSRAEYRLLLRQDNADLRLTPLARAMGLVASERAEGVERKRSAIAAEVARLQQTSLRPDAHSAAPLAAAGQEPLRETVSAYQLLRRPGVTYALVEQLAPPPAPLPDGVRREIETVAQYEGYIGKQQRQVERAERLEGRRIPEDLDYGSLTGLRNEARERLAAQRPATVGQAARMAGVNPADIAVLLVHLERRSTRAERADAER